METIFKKAESYIYRQARPLDLARWNYHFEDCDSSQVLQVLSFYQNEDGGFGHGLEADSINPNSSPIQTWAATRILKEINFQEKGHPIIKGILNYLASEQDFNGQTWHNTVATNNDYPHAIWWSWSKEIEESQRKLYNPTASLSGFIIRFSDTSSDLYHLGLRLASEGIEQFMQSESIDDMHELACYVELLEYLIEAGVSHNLNLTAFHKKISQEIQKSITQDKSLWDKGYICKPSQFISGPDSLFYDENREMVSFEFFFIQSSQLSDGTWPVPWDWEAYPEQWAISKNWWQAHIIIQNILFLKQFKQIEKV